MAESGETLPLLLRVSVTSLSLCTLCVLCAVCVLHGAVQAMGLVPSPHHGSCHRCLRGMAHSRAYDPIASVAVLSAFAAEHGIDRRASVTPRLDA